MNGMNGNYSKNKERNKAIDGMRGIVAVIIALFHLEKDISFETNTIFGMGYLGVEFFFILSGFLLVREYSNKNTESSIANIMKKKLIRLYPSYILCSILLILLYSILWFRGDIYAWFRSEIFHTEGFLAELFCIQATGISDFHYINYPAWYVSALLLMSFVILVLLKYFYLSYIRYIAPIGSFLCYFWIVRTHTWSGTPSYLYGKIPTVLVRALAGMMLGSFIWFLFIKLKDKLEKISYKQSSIIEIIVVVFLLRMLLFRTEPRWNYLILVPISMLIIVMFSTKGIVSNILSHKAFLTLGKISYSFYLLQSFCSNFVLNVLKEIPSWQKVLIYLLLNFFTALIMNYLIEQFFCTILKKNEVVRKIFILCIAVFSFTILVNFNNNDRIEEKSIVLTALGEQNDLAEGSEIWIIGVQIDGKEYSAGEIFTEGWIEKQGRIGWRIYEQPEGLQQQITGEIPVGTEQKIILEANKWRGKVKIAIMGEEIQVDCYQDSEDGQIMISLPKTVSASPLKEKKFLSAIQFFWLLDIGILVFTIYQLFLLIPIKYSLKQKSFSAERQTWADGLRIFSMFQVVLLHATCNADSYFFSNLSDWYRFLYMNCFTACAVPLFFMISGNFVITPEKNFLLIVGKRIKKIIVPLFFWSVFYIIMRKWYQKEDIHIMKQVIKIGAEPQYYHLWFIYTLCGIYIVSPFISWIYYNIEKKMFYYIGIILGFIPFLLKTLEVLTGYRIAISYIEMFFPEIILFVLGKWIYDHKNYFIKKWYFWGITAFIGYAAVTLLSYYFSIKLNTSFKGFFSNYGTLPLFIMYVSIYILFLQLESKFDKLNSKIRKLLFLISESCMDIYFIHMFWYMILEGKNIFGIFYFSNHAEHIEIGILTAVFCFILSFLSSLVIRKILYFFLFIHNGVQSKREIK